MHECIPIPVFIEAKPNCAPIFESHACAVCGKTLDLIGFPATTTAKKFLRLVLRDRPICAA